jgi:SAM-dependent methyltransferase
MAHELGDVLGLDHSFRSGYKGQYLNGEYGDPVCIKAAPPDFSDARGGYGCTCMRHVLVILALLATTGCQTIPGREVRYEPTPTDIVRAMLQLAAVAPDDVVYDLGSGDGRIPITAAREFGARGVGIEIDPALVERARANARASGVADRVEFRAGDMYAADVSSATVVTLFLHPQPNLKLRPKLRADLRPGARVVSYMWDMGDWVPDDVRRVGKHGYSCGGSGGAHY